MPATCTGYLWKSGRIIKSNLKKRYFELVGSHLYYYASHAQAARGVGSAKGSDNLSGLQAVMLGAIDENAGSVAINMILANGANVQYFAKGDTLVDSEKCAKRWIDALSHLVPKKVKSVIQGQLAHSTDRGHTWSSRFVMLLPDELLVFSSETDSKCNDPVAAATSRLRFTDDFFTADAPGGANEFAFQICDLEGSTSYYLAAPDAQLKMFWMLAISRIIEKMMQKTVRITSKSLTGASIMDRNPLASALDSVKSNEMREQMEEQNLELSKKPRGRLLYDFEAENEGELSVAAGEIIILLEKISDDFWIGQYSGSRGFVQADYLEVIEDKRNAPTPPKRKVATPKLKSKPKAGPPPVPSRENKPATSQSSQQVSSYPVEEKGSAKTPPPVPSRANKPVTKSNERQNKVSSRLKHIHELRAKRSQHEKVSKEKEIQQKKEMRALRLEKEKKEEALRLEKIKKEEEKERLRKQQEAAEKKRQEEAERLKREKQKADRFKAQQRALEVERERKKAEASALKQKQQEAKRLEEKAELERKRLAQEEKLRKQQEEKEKIKMKMKAQKAKEKRDEKAKDLASSKNLGAPPAVPSKSNRRTSQLSLGKNGRVKPSVAKKSERLSKLDKNIPGNSVSRPSRKSVSDDTRKKSGGGIKARLAMWNKRVNDYEEGQKGNVFSSSYTGPDKKLKVGDAGYGKAKAGSQAEARAKAAKEW